ncbi:MAG: OmpH family outer membrane protein [Cyclobacteriaceae bacterium]
MSNKLTITVIVLVILHLITFYFLFLKPAKVVYVDSNLLLENYEGMKAARQQFQQKAVQWQANIDTLKSEVEKEIAKYEQEKAGMTAKERSLSEELLKTKQQQFIDYQKGIQQKSQQEDFQMTEKVLSEVNTFIEEYGKRKGYTLILGTTSAGNIVYAEEYLDITEALQNELNDRYLGF